MKRCDGFFLLYMFYGNHLKALKIPACGHWLEFPLDPFATAKCAWHLCDRFPNCFSHQLGHFRCSGALVRNFTNLCFLGQIFMPYNLWSLLISIELNLCFFPGGFRVVLRRFAEFSAIIVFLFGENRDLSGSQCTLSSTPTSHPLQWEDISLLI